MKVNLFSFGIAKDIIGQSNTIIEIPEGITAHALKQDLMKKYPALGGLQHFALAVNEEYSAADQIVKENDEIAIIPPVSGG